jgi:hypothetical protein
MSATPAWRKANREHLRIYLREYRRKNYAALELKRKCRLAGVPLPEKGRA